MAMKAIRYKFYFLIDLLKVLIVLTKHIILVNVPKMKGNHCFHLLKASAWLAIEFESNTN